VGGSSRCMDGEINHMDSPGLIQNTIYFRTDRICCRISCSGIDFGGPLRSCDTMNPNDNVTNAATATKILTPLTHDHYRILFNCVRAVTSSVFEDIYNKSVAASPSNGQATILPDLPITSATVIFRRRKVWNACMLRMADLWAIRW
jgi:hypothetical protein